MDKLFTELCLSPSEAYNYLCLMLEQVNAMTQQLLVEEAMQASTVEESQTSNEMIRHFEIDDETEAEFHFSPEKGIELKSIESI